MMVLKYHSNGCGVWACNGFSAKLSVNGHWLIWCKVKKQGWGVHREALCCKLTSMLTKDQIQNHNPNGPVCPPASPSCFDAGNVLTYAMNECTAHRCQPGFTYTKQRAKL